MNPPFTRERLQTLAQEFEEARIQETIEDTVEWIKTLILVKAYSESPNKSTRGHLGDVINYLPYSCRESKNKMLKLDLPLHVGRQRHFTHIFNIYNTTPYLSEIIAKLQAIFPDTTFQVDPLKTYLLVDWS